MVTKSINRTKVATAWEEVEKPIWSVMTPEGWTLTYDSEELANKAADFYQNLNWKETTLKQGDDATLKLITCFFKHSLRELKSNYNYWPRIVSIDDGDPSFGDLTGELRFLVIDTTVATDYEGTIDVRRTFLLKENDVIDIKS